MISALITGHATAISYNTVWTDDYNKDRITTTIKMESTSESFQLVAYLLTEPEENPHSTKEGKGL